MIKKLKFLFIPIIIAFIFNSCKPGFDCSFDACKVVAPSSEIVVVQDYLLNNNLVATQHCSGLFYRIENAGTGAKPGPCSNLSITYKTYFFNGPILEQQTSPVIVSLGSSIRAVRIALPLINAGGRIVFYVPPTLAYGSQEIRDQNGNVVIPPDSYFVYEMDLITVQ